MDEPEFLVECLQTIGACGDDIQFFMPALFTQDIRPGLPGCNWKIVRMN